jgi:hypothetical protein
MACRTAVRTASAASSGSHPTVHQDPAGKRTIARVNTRMYAPNGTAMWKWIGIAVAVAVAYRYAQ